MKHYNLNLQLLFLVAVLFSGCVKRELELSDGTGVRINFDWRYVQNQQEIPSEMKLLFYSEEGFYLFSRTSSSDFYQSTLPQGKYRVLIFNPDAGGVNFRNMNSFNDAELYTLPQQDTNVTASLQNIYGTSIEEMAVYAGQSTEVTVIPHYYVRTVILQLKLKGTATELAECSASIDGLSSSLNLFAGIPNPGANVQVSSPLEAKEDCYEAVYSLIGSDEQHSSMVVIDLSFSDGTHRTLSENVTDALKSLNKQEESIPLTIEMVIDVQSIDGVIVTTLEDWNYKQGDITVN